MGKRSAVVLVAMLGSCGSGSGSGNDAGGSCRTVTAACAATADCCNPLICVNNVCTTPPTCRAATAACAVTADCCNPLVCLSNRCQVAPATDVCGDHICSGNETTGSCCTDCGCPTGTTCNGATCVNAGSSTMTWTMTDACLNGEDFEVRFFDVTNLIIWPADLTQVYRLPFGQTQSVNLACTTGASVCFGADQPNHALYWGLDIDASQGCTDCCSTCANVTSSHSLSCN